MAENRKFKMLVEDILGDRHQHGGFRVGDVVKLREGIINNVDNGADFDFGIDFQEFLQEVAKSDLNLRVLRVHPRSMPDGVSLTGTPDNYVVTLGQEYAGGMFSNRFNVPPALIEHTDWKVPSNWKDKRYDETNGFYGRVEADGRIAYDGSEKLDDGPESSTTGTF